MVEPLKETRDGLVTGTKVAFLSLVAVLAISCGSGDDAEAGKPADPAAIQAGGGGGASSGGAVKKDSGPGIEQSQVDAVKAEGGVPN